jgi:hypothetical protein
MPQKLSITDSDEHHGCRRADNSQQGNPKGQGYQNCFGRNKKAHSRTDNLSGGHSQHTRNPRTGCYRNRHAYGRSAIPAGDLAACLITTGPQRSTTLTFHLDTALNDWPTLNDANHACMTP